MKDDILIDNDTKDNDTMKDHVNMIDSYMKDDILKDDNKMKDDNANKILGDEKDKEYEKEALKLIEDYISNDDKHNNEKLDDDKHDDDNHDDDKDDDDKLNDDKHDDDKNYDNHDQEKHEDYKHEDQHYDGKYDHEKGNDDNHVYENNDNEKIGEENEDEDEKDDDENNVNYKFFIGADSHYLDFWNLRNKTFIKNFKFSNFKILKITKDFKRVFACKSSKMEIWDLFFNSDIIFKSNCFGNIIQTPEFKYLEINLEGTQAFSANSDNSIKIWNVNKLKIYKTQENAHKKYISSILYVENLKKLFSAGGDNLIKIWNAEDIKLLGKLEAHRKINFLSIWKEDKIISATNKIIGIWDLTKQKQYGNFLTGHSDKIFSLLVVPDLDCLASVSKDKKFIIWNLKTQKQKNCITHDIGFKNIILRLQVF